MFFNAEKKSMSANIHELQHWLEKTNMKDEQRILRIPLIGFLLKNLGLKYIIKKPENKKNQ